MDETTERYIPTYAPLPYDPQLSAQVAVLVLWDEDLYRM